MAAPHGYVPIPASPSEAGATPLLEEKASWGSPWMWRCAQPIQLPLTSADADAEALHQQRKTHCKRRVLRAFLFLFGAGLLFASFGRGFGFSNCMSGASTASFLGSPDETSLLSRVVTSHLRIVKTSGSIEGDFVLQPGHGHDIIIGDLGAEELHHKPSTSAHLWTSSGSIDVNVEVVEEDEDVDDDVASEQKKKGNSTVLSAGSRSGSVKVHLLSRPSSSPVQASLHSTSGSIHAFLPASFSGPFRIHHGSGSFTFDGSFADRAEIETDVDGFKSGFIHPSDEELGFSGEEMKKRGEGLVISSESGSVTVTDV